jgi:hypothetical protein
VRRRSLARRRRALAADGWFRQTGSWSRFHSLGQYDRSAVVIDLGTSWAIWIHVLDPTRLSMIGYDSRSRDKLFMSNAN